MREGRSGWEVMAELNSELFINFLRKLETMKQKRRRIFTQYSSVKVVSPSKCFWSRVSNSLRTPAAGVTSKALTSRKSHDTYVCRPLS